MSNEIKQTDESHGSLNSSNGITNFIIKTVIISISIIITINYVIPEIPKVPETERNKLILLSFVQNPYVLWRLSEIEQEKGNIKKATSYLEAAIGLMEMNGASDQSLKKYRDRLEKINSK
jgi:hypothetical protein